MQVHASHRLVVTSSSLMNSTGNQISSSYSCLECCNLGLTKVHCELNVSDAQTRLLSTLSAQSIISLWFQESMNTVPQWRKKKASPVVTVL